MEIFLADSMLRLEEPDPGRQVSSMQPSLVQNEKKIIMKSSSSLVSRIITL